MVILENLRIGLLADSIAGLFGWISASAAQATVDVGGTRVVALLAIVGFIAGLLACMYELKTINR